MAIDLAERDRARLDIYRAEKRFAAESLAQKVSQQKGEPR